MPELQDKTLCLAYGHDKVPRNPRTPPDWCERLADCLRHQAISRALMDGSHTVKTRACVVGKFDAFIDVDRSSAEPSQQTCNYPNCNCPFDAPADPNWCARGYPKAVKA